MNKTRANKGEHAPLCHPAYPVDCATFQLECGNDVYVLILFRALIYVKLDKKKLMDVAPIRRLDKLVSSCSMNIATILCGAKPNSKERKLTRLQARSSGCSLFTVSCAMWVQ